MRVLAVAFALLLSGCPRGEGGRGRDAAPPSAALPLSFKRDIAPVLDTHCAACHGARKNPSVELDLRPGAAWAQLVNHPAETRPGAVLVKPGDAAASLLIDKLVGALGPGEGKAMPIDATTGLAIRPSPIAEFVERRLMPWIAAGALNN